MPVLGKVDVRNMLEDQIKMHENFGSKHLDSPRNVLVYVPPGYETDLGRHYPVLYMHDGQNLVRPEDAFGGVVWGVDESAQNFIVAGQIGSLIIVGIYNTAQRVNKYTHVKAIGGKMKGHGGRADIYGRMIIEELKPFIDAEYRTKPESEFTGLGGSSLGGLVSLYLSFNRPRHL